MAAWTLYDIAYRIAREMGAVEGVATGGSATTLVDTVRLQDQYSDDWFNLGTLFIVRDAAGAHAAPEGEFARISDFTQSSGTVTVPASALSAAPASGDRYAALPERYNIDRIIAAINDVLTTIKVPTVDKTSLDTVAGQLEYDLPAAILDTNIEIYMQTWTSDSDQNRPIRLHNWYIEETGTGTQKQLIFRTQPISGRDLWIKYWIPHPSLYVYDDELRESIPIEYVAYSATLMLLQQDLYDPMTTDRSITPKIQAMENKVRMWTPAAETASPKLPVLGANNVYTDDIYQ